VHALDARDLEALSWAGLLETLEAALALPRALAGDVRQRYFPRAVVASGALLVLLGLVRRGDRLVALLSGMETRTLEANRALEALAARARSDPQLADRFADTEAGLLWSALETDAAGRAWLAELRVFLDRYGHREAAITTASLPTWRDAPEIVLGLVKGLIHEASRSDGGQPGWERARDEVLASPWLRLPPLRSAFLTLLTTARFVLQIREDTHFYATMPLPLVRRTVLEMGRRLVQVGALDTPADVFHLTLAELELVQGTWPPAASLTGELHTVVQWRIARRAAIESTPLVEMSREPASAVDGGMLLRGSPGSPGIAEGIVRVVHSGAEFGTLRPGEVLVAPFTNPGWTPLFSRAAAVVVDTGGAGSHAAIVAREYGIPAVMGTADGTRRLVDGTRVRVNGTTGVVTVLETSDAAYPG
jgi:pyruvate,water dikinase